MQICRDRLTRGPPFWMPAPDYRYNIVHAQAASLHGGARRRWTGHEISRNRNLAEPVSRIRDRNRRSRVHLSVSKNWTAGFRYDHDPLHAAKIVPRIEVAEGVPAKLPQPGNFSGKHREPGARGCGEVGEAGVGGGEGRFRAAGWDFDGGDGEVAA